MSSILACSSAGGGQGGHSEPGSHGSSLGPAQGDCGGGKGWQSIIDVGDGDGHVGHGGRRPGGRHMTPSWQDVCGECYWPRMIWHSRTCPYSRCPVLTRTLPMRQAKQAHVACAHTQRVEHKRQHPSSSTFTVAVVACGRRRCRDAEGGLHAAGMGDEWERLDKGNAMRARGQQQKRLGSAVGRRRPLPGAPSQLPSAGMHVLACRGTTPRCSRGLQRAAAASSSGFHMQW